MNDHRLHRRCPSVLPAPVRRARRCSARSRPSGIPFNEKTLWTGGPGTQGGDNYGNWDQPRPTAIADVQRMLNERQQLSPDEVVRILGPGPPGYGGYQVFGDLVLGLTQPPAAVQNCRRSLDIGRAVATVSYTVSGADSAVVILGAGTNYANSYPRSRPPATASNSTSPPRPDTATASRSASPSGSIVEVGGDCVDLAGGNTADQAAHHLR